MKNRVLSVFQFKHDNSNNRGKAINKGMSVAVAKIRSFIIMPSFLRLITKYTKCK